MVYSEEIYASWRRRLRPLLQEWRLAHAERVALLARDLAVRWQLDADKAYAAGLLHDVARDLPAQELTVLAAKMNIDIGPEESAYPVILHAPVGAVLLARDWGIDDPQILGAVRTHTIAEPGMDGLSQVLYLADLTEPGRHPFSGREELRLLMDQDLTAAMVSALKSDFARLEKQNYLIHPRALAAYHYFQQEQNKGLANKDQTREKLKEDLAGHDN